MKLLNHRARRDMFNQEEPEICVTGTQRSMEYTANKETVLRVLCGYIDIMLN